MSTSQVPQNAGATGDNESTEDEITIRTRLFYPLFGIAVIVGIILDVFILILLNTYVPGRARTPFWIFIIPIAVLVFLVSFIDDVLAKHFPNLVPEELRRQLAAAEAAKAAEVPQQQQGYPQMPGNPMPAQAAPQQQPYPGTPFAQQSNGQPQYGQPAAQPTAPQSTGYGQVPSQQAARTAPQQAPHGEQQPGQVPPSGQYGQGSQNQQPHGQAGQPGQSGPVGY